MLCVLLMHHMRLMLASKEHQPSLVNSIFQMKGDKNLLRTGCMKKLAFRTHLTVHDYKSFTVVPGYFCLVHANRSHNYLQGFHQSFY